MSGGGSTWAKILSGTVSTVRSKTRLANKNGFFLWRNISIFNGFYVNDSIHWIKLDGYQCVIGVTELIFRDNRRGFLAGSFLGNNFNTYLRGLGGQALRCYSFLTYNFWGKSKSTTAHIPMEIDI
jgi:hypothetical protein